MLRDHEDAFGHIMLDYHQGRRAYEIVERDDGFFSLSPGPQLYFSAYDEWSEIDQLAVERARGRALDIGCGAGRHALYLQESGLEVVGVDNSPLAVRVCRERGLRQVELLSIQQISQRKLGAFDTLLLLGNNFALLGKPEEMQRQLVRFKSLTRPGGQIILQNRNPYDTDVVEHQEYQTRNFHRGRMPGQLRIRVRYKRYATPWFDFLLLSAEELEKLAEGTGWRLREWVAGQDGAYVAFLDRQP